MPFRFTCDNLAIPSVPLTSQTLSNGIMAMGQESMGEVIVTDFEKRECVQRILASKQFAKAPKAGALFRLIAEADLNGEPISELLLARKLWARDDSFVPVEFSLVRSSATNVRKLLEDYYRESGAQEFIRVRVFAYRPHYERIARSPFELLYTSGLKSLKGNPKVAGMFLGAADDQQPNHPGVLAGFAELRIWRALYGYKGYMGLPVNMGLGECIDDGTDDAEKCALKAIQDDATLWRAHLILGFYYCSRRQWKNADAAFDHALKLSPTETKSHPFYAVYLLAIGKHALALELVKKQAEENPTEAWFSRIYALFLYVLDYPAKAISVLAGMLDTPCWYDDILLLSIYATEGAIGEIVEFANPLYRPDVLSSDRRQFYPAIRLLADAVSRGLDSKRELEIRARLRYWRKTGVDEEIDRNGVTNTTISLPEPDQLPRLCSFQIAIVLMVLGEHDGAIEVLEKDAQNFHPLMIWIHLWPMFDPLNTNPRFRSLVRHLTACLASITFPGQRQLFLPTTTITNLLTDLLFSTLMLTGAEDKALQGCNLSAGSGARPEREAASAADPLVLLLQPGMASTR
jgi:tetratricopeptide (TPR) repeat protein